MKLNPFELRKNDYFARDMYEMRGGWLCANKFDEAYGGYEYLLKGINTDVEWTVVCYTGSYQGELYCLGEAYGKFYYVNTGYGSCSGCDQYEAVKSDLNGLQELQDALKYKLREFESLDEFLQWFNGEYSDAWYESERNEFLNAVNKFYSHKTSEKKGV
jgi:hypothetical protein